jgi:ABC-type transport system involved in cytochrome bd biosynthesis fused ATPase/permease subunit
MPITAQVLEQFARYGGFIGILTGVLVAASLTAVVFLWRRLMQVEQDYGKRIEKLHQEQKEKLETYSKEFQDILILTHNERIAETKEVTKEMVRILEDTNQTIRGLSYAIEKLETMAKHA